MDEDDSVIWSYKHVLQVIGLSRATGDRLRRRGDFPDSLELTEATRGKLGYLKYEVLDWLKNRRRRKLTPLA